jgi:hypothetical protein
VSPAVPARRAVAPAMSLYVRCGELVIAISIDQIVRVLLIEELAPGTRVGGGDLTRIHFEGLALPAWDLRLLLGLRRVSEPQTWIIVGALRDGHRRRFAICCDRSLTVRPRISEHPLPAQMFTGRPGAVTAAFDTGPLGGSGDLAPTGFALSTAHLLGADELAALEQASSHGQLTW